MQPMMLLLMMATPTQDALTTMERATGAQYLQARARMIEQGSIAELEALRRESRYDAASWKREVIADAAHFWLTRRADAEHAYALEGLQPATYLKRRRPEPEAARELVQLDAAPIVFELLLKTKDQVALRNDRERAAFEDALVIALGASSHPAAEPALLAIARSDRWRAPLRKLAAKNLRDERELTAMLSDPILAIGAVQGLGQVRTRAAVAVLIGASKQPDLRLAAIRALGSVASPTVLARSG